MHDHLEKFCVLIVSTTAKCERPPNSLDFNPLDYYVWGARLQAFSKLNLEPKTITKLKTTEQIHAWDGLPQTFADVLMHVFRTASGGHLQHRL